MKITYVSIENFGKLHNVKSKFGPGLNIACKENGWGKSTLAGFIKAMFYGLEGDRKSDMSINERKKYAPWQGGVFGGSLNFVVDDKEYIVTRIFHDKLSEDEFELRDAKTNLLSEDYSCNLGEELFFINGESFLKTIYFKQNDNMLASVTGDINAKLGDGSESIDLNRFFMADECLKKAINNLSPERKTGTIYRLKDRTSEYRANLTSLSDIPERIALLENEVGLSENYLESKKSDLNELGKLKNEASAYEKNLVIYERFEELQADFEEIESEMKRAKNGNIFVKKLFSFVLLLTGICLTVCSLLFLLNIDFISLQIEIPNSGLIAFLLAGVFCVLYSLLKMNSSSSDDDLKSIERIYNERLKKLSKYEEKHNIDEVIESIKRGDELNLSSLEVQYKEITESIENTISRLQKQKNELNKLYDQLEYSKELSSDLESTLEKVNDYEQLYKNVLLAKKYLQQAKNNLTSKYQAPLEEGFKKYYSIINGDNNDIYHIDSNSELTKEEAGKQRSVDSLSCGYKDMAGLCKRIAMIDAMYTAQKPVLILDDPFINLDDNKLLGAKTLLKEVAKEYQIIYLTCSTTRK